MGRADDPGQTPPTIVVPLDGSPLAERALPYAAWLARRTGDRLLLLRAIMATAPASEAAARLATLARLWRDAGIVVETRCATLRTYEDDLIAEAILAAANTQGAVLIAMATRGGGGLGRSRYGSVAEHVLRYAETPVLLVPATGDHPWPEDRPLRLLVPLDGSRHAEGALGTVTATLADIPVEAVVARVLEAETSDYVLAYPPPDVPGRTALDDVGAYLDATAGPLRAFASSVEIATAVGEPAAALGLLAQARRVDLITMTAHGRSGRGSDALGLTAQRLLQQTEVPLLIRGPVPRLSAFSGD